MNIMKALVHGLIVSGALSVVFAGDPARPVTEVVGPLMQKYDTNGNGKIDVEERKGYVRERAKLVREDAKREAALRPAVSPEVRLFLEPPSWTPEKVAWYDANKDGKLDLAERRQERLDAVKAAEAKFKQSDTNRDGRLDAAERQAAFARKP